MANAGSENSIDHYTLVSKLAQGSHSQIWEATEGDTGARRVAMKLLNEEAFKDPAQKAALKSEHRIGKSFDHPNIIKYYELVFKKTHAYFTMELFRAPNLKTALHTDLNSVHYRFARLVELVSLALEQVHSKGWIHKDIKPDNILFNRSSEVRLIDFSLSSKVQSAIAKLFTRKSKLVQGTRTYMAPEQIQAKSLSPQTDMYSLGITLFECLAGEPPFKGSTPQNLLLRHCTEPAPPPSMYNPNVTPEMDRLIQRLLEKKPEKRFKTMSDFLLEFRRVNIWKEPIPEQVVKLDEAEEAQKNLSLGDRRDSRTDAMLTATNAANAKLGSLAPTAAKPTIPPAKPAAAAVAKAPAPPVPPAPAAAAPRPPAPAAPVAPTARPPAPAGQSAAAQLASGAPPAARPPQATQPTAAPARPVQPAARPAPPAAGQPRPATAPQPAASRPATAPASKPPAPAPARPAATQPAARPQVKPPVKPVSKPPPDDAMNIEDMPSFDELPPVS